MGGWIVVTEGLSIWFLRVDYLGAIMFGRAFGFSLINFFIFGDGLFGTIWTR